MNSSLLKCVKEFVIYTQILAFLIHRRADSVVVSKAAQITLLLIIPKSVSLLIPFNNFEAHFFGFSVKCRRWFIQKRFSFEWKPLTFVIIYNLKLQLNRFFRISGDLENTDCMFLSCHVRVSEWIHTLYLPECQGTPCSKQARYLKFKWLQWDSNPQPLSS